MNIKTLCLTGALLLTGISIYAQKKKEVINGLQHSVASITTGLQSPL